MILADPDFLIILACYLQQAACDQVPQLRLGQIRSPWPGSPTASRRHDARLSSGAASGATRPVRSASASPTAWVAGSALSDVAC